MKMLQCTETEREGNHVISTESALLRVLIFARDIPGNAAVVQDGETGFLFKCEEEFFEKVERVLGKGEGERERERIVANAFEYVKREFSFEKEREGYCGLVSEHLGCERGEEIPSVNGCF